MPDLFTSPPPTKVGQANAEFLARIATMKPAQISKITPDDFPHASPSLVIDNVRFHGGDND